jgi:hypothetical protein
MPTPRLLRPVAALAAGALVATTMTTVLAGPAHADRADDGATWLEDQLTGSLVHNDQFDFDDYGLTLDVGFGLRAIGGHGATVRAIRDEMADHVDSYTTGADFGQPENVFAGSLAKLTAYVQASGGDPRAYGGADLVRRLNNRILSVRPVKGRLRDKGADDYTNTIGQSFAARALARADSRKAGGAIRFLLKQQCHAGFFRLGLATQDADKQGCDAAPASKRSPDTDATALAVLNLRAMPIGHRTAPVRQAIADATAWLKKRQKDNGSLGGGTSTEGSNTNSTGLAAWALGDSGACRPAARAARWVRDLQVVDAGGTSLEGEDGAIAYDAAGYAEGEDGGISDEERDQWRRATAQAAPGLSYLRVADCS